MTGVWTISDNGQQMDAGATITAIGLMSGTSMDGIDVALVRSDGQKVAEIGPAATFPYTETERSAIRAAMLEAADHAPLPEPPPAFDAVARMLAERHADAVRQFMGAHGLAPDDIGVIGFHGQTIRHAPDLKVTWQIGDGEDLARALGIPVVADFRRADVLAGGEGAPLAPLYHAALLRSSTLAPDAWPVAVINIGGVANVTWVAGAAEDDGILAFDTGPGNALIDDWVRAKNAGDCDRDGRLALMGEADRARVERWLDLPYFARTPPKSLDRDEFRDCIVGDLSLEDGAATLTAFTAATIARARDHMPAAPRSIFVCGGGRHNPALMRAIAEECRQQVAPVEAIGWRGDSLEAEAFAYLAVRALHGLPLSLPTTTGVAAPMHGGKLFKP